MPARKHVIVNPGIDKRSGGCCQNIVRPRILRCVQQGSGGCCSANPQMPDDDTNLCQAQHKPEDKERKVNTLGRVDDDPHPGAAEAPTGESIKED